MTTPSINKETLKIIENIVLNIFKPEKIITDKNIEDFIKQVYDNPRYTYHVHDIVQNLIHVKNINNANFLKFLDMKGQDFVDNILKSSDTKYIHIFETVYFNSHVVSLYTYLFKTTVVPSSSISGELFRVVLNRILYETNKKNKRRITNIMNTVANRFKHVNVLYKTIDNLYSEITVVYNRPPEYILNNEKIFEEIFADDGMPDFNKLTDVEKKNIKLSDLEDLDLQKDKTQYKNEDKEEDKDLQEDLFVTETYRKPYMYAHNRVWYNPYGPHNPKFTEYVIFYLLSVDVIQRAINNNKLPHVKRLLEEYPPNFNPQELYFLFLKYNELPSMFIKALKDITNTDYTQKFIDYTNILLNTDNIKTVEDLDKLFYDDRVVEMMDKASIEDIDYRKISKMM